MKLARWSFLFLLLSCLYANNIPLRGVLLIESAKDVQRTSLENIEGVEVRNVDIPGSLSVLNRALDPFFGDLITQELLTEISQAVLAYYKTYYHPLVNIQIPSQPMHSGVVQLVVQEARLGAVHAVGNTNFSSRRLEGYVSLREGDPIVSTALISDLNWINRNPFRTTDLAFTPSAKAGYTDIELVTKDRFPWRVYTGVDNTGIAESGHNRWFAGFNWGNVFGSDHFLTYQFTSGSRYNEFWAHSINYTAPLPWRHTLDLYGGYSQVHATLQNRAGMRTHGSTAQASLRYEIPLSPSISLLHEFTFGFDWKRTNTGLLNDDVFFFGKTANITQLMAGLNGGLQTAHTKNSATIELFGSPGQWIPDQENSHYNDLRAGAKNTYVYMRAALSSIFLLPKSFTCDPIFRMQLSSANLLASEQFGLGGHDTVRGYEEREINVDNALVFNFELRTPKTPLIGLLSKAQRLNIQDTLVFLVFLDCGYGWNHQLFLDEPSSQYLLGAGPGVRYMIQRYLTLRADYGFKLHQPKDSPNPNHGMLYFGVVASF